MSTRPRVLQSKMRARCAHLCLSDQRERLGAWNFPRQSTFPAIGSRAQPNAVKRFTSFNPMPQARLAPAATNLACGIGLNRSVLRPETTTRSVANLSIFPTQFSSRHCADPLEGTEHRRGSAPFSDPAFSDQTTTSGIHIPQQTVPRDQK